MMMLMTILILITYNVDDDIDDNVTFQASWGVQGAEAEEDLGLQCPAELPSGKAFGIFWGIWDVSIWLIESRMAIWHLTNSFSTYLETMLSNVLQCSPTVSWLWSDRIVLLLGSGRKTWRWRHLWRKSELWKTSLKTMWGRGEKPSSCRIWRWEGGPCGFICYQDRDIEYPPCDTEHVHLRTKVALSSLYSEDLWILWIGSFIGWLKARCPSSKG